MRIISSARLIFPIPLIGVIIQTSIRHRLIALLVLLLSLLLLLETGHFRRAAGLGESLLLEINSKTRRNQHSQECKDSCRQCFCDSCLWPFTFWKVKVGFSVISVVVLHCRHNYWTISPVSISLIFIIASSQAVWHRSIADNTPSCPHRMPSICHAVCPSSHFHDSSP